jgi:hypothetical protein
MAQKNKNLEKYLEKYSVGDRWPLVCKSRDNVDNVVVIPALAESDHLFGSLESLSNNPGQDLESTLVICVVNNKMSAPPGEIADNRKTLKILKCLVDGRMPKDATLDAALDSSLYEIVRKGMRIAFVDASSPECEMPEKEGGVGLARKIGFDSALELYDGEREGTMLLCSLDADTIVKENYLLSVRDYFEKNESAAAVVAFEHQKAENPAEQAAICAYEIFLRYYVLGLGFAGSHYAFHSIGSTMVCTAGGYVSVRGMNRRKAGEDFYFLNKLAKINSMGRVTATRVYPSSRPSDRVPFGTGKRVARFKEEPQDGYHIYSPHVFAVLKEWLHYISSCDDKNSDLILLKAKDIHPALEIFLQNFRFDDVWPRLLKNTKSGDSLSRHFFYWFDGFKQFKLIRHLTQNGLPAWDMFAALKELFEMMGKEISCADDPGKIPPLEKQMKILDCMKQIEYGSGDATP